MTLSFVPLSPQQLNETGSPVGGNQPILTFVFSLRTSVLLPPDGTTLIAFTDVNTDVNTDVADVR
jgi:hypothetical protein